MTVFLPGLCSVTFRRLPIDRVVRLAADAGLQGIEWGADIHVPPGDLTAARDAVAACAAADIAIPSYGTYIRAGADDPQQEIAPVLDTAGQLGATNLRVWAGDVGSADASGDQHRRVVDALRDCAVAAADRAITVSLEYHRNTLTDTAAATGALLAAVAHPNCFTYWQPVPDTPADDAVAEINRLAQALSHLHVFHWRGDNVRHPLGDAEPFWHAVLGAVPPGTWTAARYAFLEFVRDDDPGQFLADAAVLKRLINARASPRSTDRSAALGVQ